MMIKRALLCLIVAFLLQNPRAAAQQSQGTPYLKKVIIVMRHGVRAPHLAPPLSFDDYSKKPWPKWNVPADDLTQRGYQLVQGLGGYFRGHYKEPLALEKEGCAVLDQTYSRADNAERTKETAKAFLAGFLPRCSLSIPITALPHKDPTLSPCPQRFVF